MSTVTEQTAAETTVTEAAAPAAEQQPAHKARRWPWIVALVVVAALGATGTGIAASQAQAANAELAAVQEDYADLETRSEIAQSSLDLIRDHRDRLQAQLDELQG